MDTPLYPPPLFKYRYRCTFTHFQVVHWPDYLEIPREPEISRDAICLIQNLLTNQERRLGRNGADEIKQHPFFSTIQFQGLRQKTAFFVPTIRYATDTSNFDSIDENKLMSLEARRDGTLENGYPEHAFFEFTFKRFFDESGHAIAMKMPGATNEDGKPVFV